MKKELDYFYIGHSYGGNQSWFLDFWMHIGGCAALCACDSIILLEKNKIKTGLYPFSIEKLTKGDYIRFGKMMKPYIRPRLGGVDRLDLFIEGINNYFKDLNYTELEVEKLESENEQNYFQAAFFLKNSINKGFPVSFLLLKHKSREFSPILWHWFMIVGYNEYDDELYVKVATYGNWKYYSFRKMWNSGFDNNGGMILYQ